MPWAGPLLSGTGAAGGAETQIAALARGLGARGLRVGLVTVGRRSELPRRIEGVEGIAQPPPPRVRGLAGFVLDAGTFIALLRRRARTVVVRNANRGVAVAALA